MMQYLLSVHSVEGEVREPMSAESVTQVGILEEELKSAGAWVFSGRLHEPDSATVVRVSGGEVLTTDGPFAESKEAPGRPPHHPGGKDLDAGAELGQSRVTAAINVPTEVRPLWDAEQAARACANSVRGTGC